MKVKVLSKTQFEDSVVPKLKEKWLNDAFFISILDPDNPHNYFPDCDNYKTLWFYDLEFELNDYKIFDEEMANELLDFILDNRFKKNCIVHCSAGVSRSGAVGEFINDILGSQSWSEFKENNLQICPNLLVKKLLHKVNNQGD